MKIIIFFNFFNFVLSTFCNFNITLPPSSQFFFKSSCNLQLNNSVYTIFIQNKRQLPAYIPPENNITTTSIPLIEILYIVIGISGLLNIIFIICIIIIYIKYKKALMISRIIRFPMECIFKENKEDNEFFKNARTIKTIQI